MRKAVLLAVFVLAVALPLWAQMPMMRMPEMPVEFKIPPVGSWCEYKIVDKADNDTVIFKYSLPSKEKFDNEDCHWFEFQVSEDEELSIVKMLISGDPNEPKNLKRLIIKSGDEPAIEVPVGMMQAHAEESEGEEAEPEKEIESEEEEKAAELKVGEETIETKAGKLECTHLRIKDEEEVIDMWVNDALPFFSLAKMTSNESTMEIMGFGDSGAKSAITEEPQKMPMPGIPGAGR